MKPSIRTLALRAGILGGPLLVALVVYVVRDPFRVLRTHDFGDYYDEAAPVELNRDYVSLQLFRKYEPRDRFDSFIFGSSRSFPIQCRDWAPHLPPEAHPFHWPAASENVYGIAMKLEYLEKQGIPIHNALLEVTTGLGGAEPRWDGMHRLPYELTGESWLDFQATFLKAYFSEFYFVKYLAYVATGQTTPFNAGVLGIRRGAIHIEPETNDYLFASNESELAQDPEGYYARRRALFSRPSGAPACSFPMVHERQRAVLARIRAVLERQHTSYRLVLMPMYDQACLDPEDRRQLDEVFGAQNVFDFTGVNALTADESNFYDAGHVRANTAARVLDAIYGRSDRSLR